MPYVERPAYRAPFWLPGGHAQTIVPALVRRLPLLRYSRFRLPTPDGDVILLDQTLASERRGETAVILSHGLEGHSRRTYMRGLSLACLAEGWDCYARNFRACGGEMNLTSGMYHSGQTDDLHTVVTYCRELGYPRLFLAGFSMGGNQTLKYLGEDAERAAVDGAVVFSVPCHLPGSARCLDKPGNAVYMRYFLRTLRQKVRLKHAGYPELYPLRGLDGIRTFSEFDNTYTAPVHGFASADDYWEKASCLPHLERIRVPTLLVNARNDPFLSPRCFPESVARASDFLTLETPSEGGHVGFPSFGGRGPWWSERRATAFLRGLLP